MHFTYNQPSEEATHAVSENENFKIIEAVLSDQKQTDSRIISLLKSICIPFRRNNYRRIASEQNAKALRDRLKQVEVQQQAMLSVLNDLYNHVHSTSYSPNPSS